MLILLLYRIKFYVGGNPKESSHQQPVYYSWLMFSKDTYSELTKCLQTCPFADCWNWIIYRPDADAEPRQPKHSPVTSSSIRFCWTQNQILLIRIFHSDSGSVSYGMDQPLLSDTIRRWCLSFFGHLCCADTSQDHPQACQACIRGPPKDLWCRTGRPRQTWIEDDLHPLNFGLATARRWALDRLTTLGGRYI